ncbi:hypothetical protein ACQP1S_00655 [Micromonospora matsumotoense]|uniref:tetratricopeptide repeat protein n=1 Tax=Micromonospora matsumotoense TaxID=121616 RepID=UPI003D923AF4
MSTLLSGLPEHPALTVLKATAFLDTSMPEEALALLEAINGDEAPRAAALLGYIWLLQGRNHQALKELRRAHRHDPSDIDTIMNLAVSYWRIGSPKKAISFSRQAVALAPNRKDTVLALLDYLVRSGEITSASAELKRLRDRNVAPLPEFGAMQAQIALRQGDMKRASSTLKGAANLAKREENLVFAAELRGNAALVDHARGRIDRSEARSLIKAYLKDASGSTALVTMLADITAATSEAREVRAFASRLPKSMDSPECEGLSTRLSFLELHFEEAVERAKTWCRNDPYDSSAAAIAVHLLGHWTEDWLMASEIGLGAIKRTGSSDSLANITAYALALAGRGDAGIEVLSRTGKLDYVRTATMGLCRIARGEFREGMALYRTAADLADRERPDGSARALMTLYQAMALKRLPTVRDRDHVEIQATALPDVVLPNDWEDFVDFIFLREVAARSGWEWPVLV